MPNSKDVKPIENELAPLQQTPPNVILKQDIHDIEGFFEVVSIAPSHIPKNLWDSRKVYVNGTTYREYIYDYKNHAWRYSTLT